MRGREGGSVHAYLWSKTSLAELAPFLKAIIISHSPDEAIVLASRPLVRVLSCHSHTIRLNKHKYSHKWKQEGKHTQASSFWKWFGKPVERRQLAVLPSLIQGASEHLLRFDRLQLMGNKSLFIYWIGTGNSNRDFPDETMDVAGWDRIMHLPINSTDWTHLRIF